MYRKGHILVCTCIPYPVCCAEGPRTVYALTLAMLCVLIYELVVNDKAQGTPVSFKVRELYAPVRMRLWTYVCFAAGRQSNARAIGERADQPRRPLSCLHEERVGYSAHYPVCMCVLL